MPARKVDVSRIYTEVGFQDRESCLEYDHQAAKRAQRERTYANFVAYSAGLLPQCLLGGECYPAVKYASVEVKV